MKKSKDLKKVTCECGEEILLVADVTAMGKAIEDHIDLHLHGLRAPTCTATEADHLRNVLIAQVLSMISLFDEE